MPGARHDDFYVAEQVWCVEKQRSTDNITESISAKVARTRNKRESGDSWFTVKAVEETPLDSSRYSVGPLLLSRLSDYQMSVYRQQI